MNAPWHNILFDRFLNESLPQMLAERLLLIDYAVKETDRYTCRIKLTLDSPSGDVVTEYENIPQAKQDGIFEIKGKRLVVVG